MGRTVCLWLIGCLALASAIPVPGPISEQDLMNMILNANPEDNDIELKGQEAQPLIADSDVEVQEDPTQPEIPEQEEPIPIAEEAQELPQPEEPEMVSDVQQTQEIITNPEPEVSEAENLSVELPSVSEGDQGETLTEDHVLVPEEGDLQAEPEVLLPLPESEPIQEDPEDMMPLPVEEPVQTEPEEIWPLFEDQPVQIEAEEEEMLPLSDEQYLPMPEDQLPMIDADEEQMIPVPYDQFFPEEDYQSSPVVEDDRIFFVVEEEVIPADDGDEGEQETYVVEDEQALSFTEEEEEEEEDIIPVFEEELQEEEPIEPYEVQLIPVPEEDDFELESEDSIMNFGNEEQMPIVEEPEMIPEVIVVGMEENEFNRPMSDVLMIPGFVDEEPQLEADMPTDDMHDPHFDSFVPPYFGEEEENDEFPTIIEEPQSPVYFDIFAEPPSFPVDIHNMEVPEDISVEDMSEDHLPESEILHYYYYPHIMPAHEDDGDQFSGPVSGGVPGNLYEEDYRPVDEPLGDYIIPEGDLPIEDFRSDNVEVNEEAVFVADEINSEYQVPQEETFITDMSDDHLPKSGILKYYYYPPIMPAREYNTDQFSGPVLGESLPRNPYEEDYRSVDETFDDYFIPEGDLSIEDSLFDDGEVNEEAVFEINEANSEYQVPQEENVPLMEGPSFESFPIMAEMPHDMIPEYIPHNVDEVIVGDVFTPELPDEEVIVRDTFTPNLPTEEVYPPFMENDHVHPFESVMANPMIDEDVPIQMDDSQMPVIMPGEETIFVIDTQDSTQGSEKPIIEIFHMETSSDIPNSQFPLNLPTLSKLLGTKLMNKSMAQDLINTVSQHMFGNKQIIPVEEYPEDESTPIIIEQEMVWIPDNEEQQPIIFPQDNSHRHNFPVFPNQWNEENYFHPPESDYFPRLPQQEQVPVYGPVHIPSLSYNPPPRPILDIQQPHTMYDEYDDDMFPQTPDFMPPFEVPDEAREDDFTTFDDDFVNMEGPVNQFNIVSELYQPSRLQQFPNKFNNPNSFELPSLAKAAFQQDFHGPNTFPLNFRRPDFSLDFRNEYSGPYPERTTQINNPENVHQEQFVSMQDFQQESNLPVTPNEFMPMQSEPEKMLDDPNEQNVNMNLQVFRTSPLAMNPKRFNQQQQQFDVQVSFVPYENNYDFPQLDPNDFSYGYNFPYAQQPNNFNNFNPYPRYPSSSYNRPPYGVPNSYQNAGLYPSHPNQNRYAMSYENRVRQHYNYHPYNYPTLTW